MVTHGLQMAPYLPLTSSSAHTTTQCTLCVHFTFCSYYHTMYTLCSLHLLLILPHNVHSVFTSPSPHTTTLRTLCVHFTFCLSCAVSSVICLVASSLKLLSWSFSPSSLSTARAWACTRGGGWGEGEKWEVWQGVGGGEKPFR